MQDLLFIGNGTHSDWFKKLLFQDFMMTLMPCVFLFVTSPFYFVFASKSKNNFNSVICLSKSVLGSGLTVIYLLDLIYRLHEYFSLAYKHPLHLLQPCVLLVSESLATLVVLFDRHRGRRINFLMFFYRLLMEISMCFIMLVSVRCRVHPEDFSETLHGHQHYCKLGCVVVLSIALLLNTTLLILFGFVADKDVSTSADERISPESSAPLLSLLTFFWFSRFVYDAGKRGLDYCDVWSLQEESRCLKVSKRFHNKWLNLGFKRFTDSQRQNVKIYETHDENYDENHKLEITREDLVVDENIALDEKLLDKPEIEVGGHAPSKLRLLEVLYKTFGGLFVAGVCLNIMHDLLMFASPYIFKNLVTFIMDDDAPLSEGLFFVGLLFGCSLVLVLLRHQYTMKYNIIGLRVQSTLLSAIYKKSLLICPSEQFGLGEIVNLMSVDVQKVVDMVSMVNYLWSCPIQLTLGTYFLWQLLGPSVLGGMFVAVIMLPINAWVAKKCKKFQINQMTFKDARIKILDEIINGIKVIKLYAWEVIFKGKVSKVRDDELRVLRRAAYLTAVATFAWSSTPFLISLTTFGLYLLASPENVLTAEKAFVSLTLFNILRMPLSMLPMFVTNVLVTKVSIKRLERFLTLVEMPSRMSSLHKFLPPSAFLIDSAVSFKSACIGWGRMEKENIILNNINLEIPRGCLAAIVGSVGSGKSTLLSAIVGEAQLSGDECHVRGSIAYSGQQAWLQNQTLRENILFGLKMDEVRYREVLEACALFPDLETFPAGDETEVGERGLTLSGGQKQRVCLARAAYSGAEICVFDDPFASVDVHVAKHLFDRILSNSGLLKDKTRIIATNSVSFLPFVDLVVILDDGEVSDVGSYDNLLLGNKEFHLFAQNFISGSSNKDIYCFGSKAVKKSSRRKRVQSLTREELILDELKLPVPTSLLNSNNLSRYKSCFEINNKRDEDFDHSLLRQIPNLAKSETFLEEVFMESAKMANLKMESVHDLNSKVNDGKLVKDEEIKKEKVSSKVFLAYLKSIGFPLGILALVSFIINNCLSASTNIWLGIWTDSAGARNSSSFSDSSLNSTLNTSPKTQSFFGLGVYAGLGFSCVLTLLVRSFFSAMACSEASKVMYSNMVDCLLSVPLSFFDKTPKGRIINRASYDVATLDYIMPFTVSGFCNIIIICLITLGIISINIPLFIAPFIVLLVLYVLLQRYFVSTSRQLRRMSSNMRSHVFSHLSETLQGLSTIRAFGVSKCFTEDMHRKVDDMQEVCYLSHVSQRWLGVWLEFIGIMLVSTVALFAVVGKSELSAGMVALSLTYAFDIIQNLNSLVTMFCELETNLVAVERIKEYSDLDPEETRGTHSSVLHPSWPHEGQIEFQNYSSRYRPSTDYVLKKLSVLIKPGEKIGIVGRTGSGKSSMFMSLFRVLGALEGSIVIDEVDIANIPLKILRSKMTLVPQDPMIFSGSIRFNLDPTGVCSDEELWNSLGETSLRKHVFELSGHLDHECNPNGNTLSLGQQQLLCLNRALLRKSKILMLDEATASIDIETESSIKRFLERRFNTKPSLGRTGFDVSLDLTDTRLSTDDLGQAGNAAAESCTLIVIAHRLGTVLNCDRILVLENGKLEEAGEPRSLLANESSRFYKLYNNLI